MPRVRAYGDAGLVGIAQAVVFGHIIYNSTSQLGLILSPRDIWQCLAAFLIATPRNEGIIGI